MRYFTVQEPELDMLGLVNNKAAAFFSAGSFFAAVSVDVLTAWLYVGSMSDAAFLVARASLIGSGAATLIMFALGAYEISSRSAIVSRIKKESPDE